MKLDITIDITPAVATAIDQLASGSTTEKLLFTLITDQRQLMATTKEMTAAFGDLKSSLTTEISQIEKKIAALQQSLDENGTEAERDAHLADILSTTERIKGIIADTPTGDGGNGDELPTDEEPA